MSFRRIEPFNTVLASVGIALEKIKGFKESDEELNISNATKVFALTAEGIAENVLDGSYLQGVSDVLGRHGKKREKMIYRFGASLVPYSSFWRSINRSYEAHTEGMAKLRENENFLDALGQVIPGLSKKTPARINVWGEEITLPGGVFRHWLPYKWSKETKDPVELELERIGMYPSLPGKHITIHGKPVELPDALYREYCITYGVEAKKRLEASIEPNLGIESAKKRYERRLDGVRNSILPMVKMKYYSMQKNKKK